MKRIMRFYRKINTELEHCFNVEISEVLDDKEMSSLCWLLSETFDPHGFRHATLLEGPIVEVGPLMNFATALNTNAVSIAHACGLKKVQRIERSRRYSVPAGISPKEFVRGKYDRMTEGVYARHLTTFDSGLVPEPVFDVPLIEEGKAALEKINKKMGLGMDDWDIDYNYNLFVNILKRNPTNVECFQLGQANSEHSRHWFFKGQIAIDDKVMPQTLMKVVSAPLNRQLINNSVIAFRDNSSAIRGFDVVTILPENPGQPSAFKREVVNYDIIFTAETHNFPSGIAPFPGAETGTGGRIRDIQATGRGGLVIAGTAGYCVGNLQIPGYPLPWEDSSFVYPGNLASPLEIEVQTSNGASDYGNKFGEPVIQGFTRSFGMRLPDGERREWLKPIMFTGGIGQMNSQHREKGNPEKGMLILEIGGPAYRIGRGGGAASSMIQGDNIAELDFNAVQRGDAEMEQKMNRAIRACIEMGSRNPIVSGHDQGAGGPCNVVTELINPVGGRVEIRKINLGDNTLAVLDIWGAEYQERNGLLIRPDRLLEFLAICEREKVPYEILGEITGDGRIVVYDSNDDSTPVSLPLAEILGDMPQKTFKFERIASRLNPFILPEGVSLMEALNRVLRLVSVGSKRFLTTKVDRSVSGLIARQQCVGPLHITLSDGAVVTQSHLDLTGAAEAIGEQPIYTLLDPAAMARMSVGESLTNLMWAKITAPEDIKCSANWMWAAKLAGEGAKLYDAAVAMSDIMIDLGIAVDGGKDSLSMATRVGSETVKSPGALVISAYATMEDVTQVITPDLKEVGNYLYHIDLAPGEKRLGGSALAHVYSQIGDECPDVDGVLLKRVFVAVQDMIDKNLIVSGHDVSDGGLVVTLLEMAFAGNCGILVDLITDNIMAELFSQELQLVVEVPILKEDEFIDLCGKHKIPWKFIGSILEEPRIIINREERLGQTVQVFNEDMRVLRELWEETSYQLDKLQANPECVAEEKKVNFDRQGPQYKVTFDPAKTPSGVMEDINRPKVAIIREEGSNGDREMTAAFYSAGFDPWDITMTDLLEGRVTLKDFRGVVFVGGFSYADVLDSAKGWAGTILFNEKLKKMFDEFYNRPDTFSFGVCNGCQLMALLGWVPWQGIPTKEQPRFIKNLSGRFESRFSTVKILASPAIMLKDMEESVLGVWVAHGEGRLFFPESNIIDYAAVRDLMPIRYVDDSSEITQVYPFNPNGSAFGAAAICSPNGRHLAMMPHSERTFLKWQWPWMPEDMKDLEASPWLKMFQNAREWCEKN